MDYPELPKESEDWASNTTNYSADQMRAYVDADRAQRAAQPPPPSEPSMQDALAAGDGTLHGAIDYWQAKCAELEAKLAQSAQPAIAWRCTGEGLKRFMTQEQYEAQGLGVKKWYEPYKCASCLGTAQPVEVPSDFHTHKNAWRSALEIAEQNALVSPPDLDDKSYWQHEIAAFDRAYSELGAQPVSPSADQIALASNVSGLEQTPFEAGCEVLAYLREQGATYYYMHRMLTCLYDKNEDEPKYRAERERLIEQLRKKCAALEAEIAQPVEASPSATSLLLRALSHIRWASFGECRTAGHDGPPPSASEVTRDIEAVLTQPVGAQQVAEVWQPMSTAPKDGTLVRLLVNFEDHATEDGEGPHPTVGSNTWDNHHDFDEWLFAGWCWTQDCYTQGVGTPVGWLPMLSSAQPVEVQRVPLSWAEVVNGADQHYMLVQPEHVCVFDKGVKFAENHHGIKPTSSEGGSL